MDIPSNETWQNHLVRKKIKKINVLALLANEIIWRPAPGRQYVLTHAFAKTRNHTGTNSDDPSISIDNGTDGQSLVAAVDLADQTVGSVQRLAVVGNYVIDYDHPLRLQIGDAPAGSTVYDVDIILFAMKISE